MFGRKLSVMCGSVTPSVLSSSCGVSGLTGELSVELSGALGFALWDLGLRRRRDLGTNLLPLAFLLKVPSTEGHPSKSPGQAAVLAVQGRGAPGRGQEDEGRAVPVMYPGKTMTFLLWYENEVFRQKWARLRLAAAVLHPIVSTPP